MQFFITIWIGDNTQPLQQVGGSTRKSFSARFFAQSNSKLPRASLFPRSPVGSILKGRSDKQAALEYDSVPELTEGSHVPPESDSTKQVKALTCLYKKNAVIVEVYLSLIEKDAHRQASLLGEPLFSC